MRTGSGELLQIEQGNGGKQVNWKETKMEKEGGFRRKLRRGSSRGRAHAEFSKKVTFFGEACTPTETGESFSDRLPQSTMRRFALFPGSSREKSGRKKHWLAQRAKQREVCVERLSRLGIEKTQEKSGFFRPGEAAKQKAALTHLILLFLCGFFRFQEAVSSEAPLQGPRHANSRSALLSQLS
ncbi:hypothetical protein TGGT1_224100 [Toxoplasma gondii GT1]|uniref:Uncharacterized protein n=2 Tax=Toxoplasma gondii TaxID=5811 RepID=S7W4Q2_TOXGG|nr:hypothetical protein TGGT1_224100 [Toxoplasma gondii GT1]KAF4640464.1 hypothetical protein TGRH88_043900 [Toxoplasma gondii]